MPKNVHKVASVDRVELRIDKIAVKIYKEQIFSMVNIAKAFILYPVKQNTQGFPRLPKVLVSFFYRIGFVLFSLSQISQSLIGLRRYE